MFKFQVLLTIIALCTVSKGLQSFDQCFIKLDGKEYHFFINGLRDPTKFYFTEEKKTVIYDDISIFDDISVDEQGKKKIQLVITGQEKDYYVIPIVNSNLLDFALGYVSRNRKVYPIFSYTEVDANKKSAPEPSFYSIKEITQEGYQIKFFKELPKEQKRGEKILAQIFLYAQKSQKTIDSAKIIIFDSAIINYKTISVVTGKNIYDYAMQEKPQWLQFIENVQKKVKKVNLKSYWEQVADWGKELKEKIQKQVQNEVKESEQEVKNIKIEELQIKTEEPQVQAEEPQVQAEEPQVQAEEPQVKAEEPQVQAEEPQVKAEEPQVKAEEPQVQAEEPQLKTEEPQINAEEPKNQDL